MAKKTTKTTSRKSKSKTWVCPNGTFALLPLSLLDIMEELQRDRRNSMLNYLRKEWDRECCGPIVVCRMSNGRYHVPDAGHRLTVLREKHKGTELVMCQIVSDPAKFLTLNRHLTVSPNDSFKVALGCDLDPETTVATILTKNGIGISYGKKPSLGSTGSPAAFLKMYNHKGIGPKVFAKIVNTLASAYRRDDGEIEPAALSADFVRGLTIYLASTVFTGDQVCAALTQSSVTAATITAYGRQQATTGGQRWKYVAEAISIEVAKRVRSFRKAI